jgi:hypothetical protein
MRGKWGIDTMREDRTDLQTKFFVILPMITGFVGLPIQARYEIINLMRQQTYASVNDMASMFGVCSNVIPSVASCAIDSRPFGKRDVTKLLQLHHIPYVEARMIHDQQMTNEELARETIAFYLDLPRCRARIIN